MKIIRLQELRKLEKENRLLERNNRELKKQNLELMNEIRRLKILRLKQGE